MACGGLSQLSTARSNLHSPLSCPQVHAPPPCHPSSRLPPLPSTPPLHGPEQVPLGSPRTGQEREKQGALGPTCTASVSSPRASSQAAGAGRCGRVGPRPGLQRAPMTQPLGSRGTQTAGAPPRRPKGYRPGRHRARGRSRWVRGRQSAFQGSLASGQGRAARREARREQAGHTGRGPDAGDREGRPFLRAFRGDGAPASPRAIRERKPPSRQPGPFPWNATAFSPHSPASWGPGKAYRGQTRGAK